MRQPSVLLLEDVRKAFGPVVALRSGTLEVAPGSIHALVGENGAGKSTLLKVVGGVHRRDGGRFEIGGDAVDFRSTTESKAAGIAVIYQEPTLFPDLTVAENIFLGREPLRSGRRIDRAQMRARSREIFAGLGVHIDPDRPARGLSIADQQLVEIAKAISLDARILVMDEPTAALSGREVDRLFAVARGLRDAGCGLVFVSHRMGEVFSLCDTVTVMRDGAHVWSGPVEQTTVDEVVGRMVGREVSELYPDLPEGRGEALLEVDGLARAGVFQDVSLRVHAGEIVGIAGLVGAGRSEIARAVFGIDRYDAGTVRVAGRALPPGDPGTAIAAGLGFVPEDRRLEGLVTTSSVARNATAVVRRRLARLGILRESAESASARRWADRLAVRTTALDMDASTMSGGNQQKVVLAKWLATDPRVLIVDEPTRGIDVGTKAEVHRLLAALAADGMAVLLISSELSEVLGMSHRVLVVREGRITAELDRADATPERVMRAATQAVAA
ncbi:ABC transporter related protein [Xylanimonas cellulosilytica DSM 15894]|uniref:ABC transporter related protein n=1 Tax=Xylanimonas cellulosilytica (strain DSM 15894 / JCM 12276 / CECT 5975 / KCTC 9989 / LMG 20990 / NBRC 107835 / XIL07) TaxID=446471 RepID=D1BY70_XYLCX|nr:sugar ABC transporter ATP-binding protein [Xylanimonas cellulosilytica]ACZ29913.1 ABC transporter related protein [Xylanimonas cellulosilytica DSM 15894]